MNTDIAVRINQIIETYQLSKKSFADRTQISQPIVSHITSGRNNPGLDVVQKILAAFPDLNPEWLISGIEPFKRPGLEEKQLLVKKMTQIQGKIVQAQQLLNNALLEINESI